MSWPLSPETTWCTPPITNTFWSGWTESCVGDWTPLEPNSSADGVRQEYRLVCPTGGERSRVRPTDGYQNGITTSLRHWSARFVPVSFTTGSIPNASWRGGYLGRHVCQRATPNPRENSPTTMCGEVGSLSRVLGIARVECLTHERERTSS